ncbi:hypothetical protein fugu_016081 [Takifugu bimaculatus]|uniref:RanBP2-type domain-containing protein n=1 Tax=Takifugu bimaculatus TaxID=433685 RepID=A0A4Z2BYF9_9TELE|nr:hypothetical protein fugu_016081 [Takifugu bimaculatus]
MDEVRRRAQSILSISGSAQDVKTEVQTIANISLPLSEKYQHLEVENILRENTEGNNSQEVLVSLGRLVKAFSILEKAATLTQSTSWKSVPSIILQDKTSDTVVIQPGDKQQEDNQQPPASLPAAVLAGQPLKPPPGICGLNVHAQCPTCVLKLCLKCDLLFHSHPDRKGHKRSVIAAAKTSSPSLSPWECSHCTTVNEMQAVLCMTCERPRLRHGHCSGQPDATLDWICQFCTYVNTGLTLACEMCNLSCKDAAQQTQMSTTDPPLPKPRVNMDLKRQKIMKEDGLNLIHQIKEAEMSGISPEEVYAAIVCSGNSIKPCVWLKSELPHLLDEICAIAASVQLSCPAGGDETCPERGDKEERPQQSDGPEATGASGKLSRAEAKVAWLAAGGNTGQSSETAAERQTEKMKELHALGFRDVSQCEEALRLSGGEVTGALSLLQRPLLEPFHQRNLDRPT